jgi:ankyrin repeat protein
MTSNISFKTEHPLFKLAYVGDLQAVIQAITDDSHLVSIKTCKGINLVMAAAMGGHYLLVKWLVIKAHANPREVDINGHTAFLWAAMYGHLSIMRWLLNRGVANVNEHSLKGYTALLYSAGYGHVEAMDCLIQEYGASPEQKSRNGITLFIYAAINGFIPVMEKIFLEKGMSCLNERAEPGMTAFLMQGTYGHVHVIKWLLAKDPRLIHQTDKYGTNIFLLAASFGQWDVMAFLLQTQMPIAVKRSQDGRGVLHVAVINGRLNILQRYYALEGDRAYYPDHFGKTPLVLAIQYRQYTIMNWLLESTPASLAEKNNCGQTPFLLAVQYGDLDTIRLLIRRGASLSEKFENTTGVLMIAAQCHDEIDVVRWLLEQGLNVNEQNCSYQTALSLAVQYKRIKIVDFLLNVPSLSYWTVFMSYHLATEEGYDCELIQGSLADHLMRMEAIAKEEGVPIPTRYCCPITLQLMMDPVVGPDGHTYERRAITKYVQMNGISPLTRAEMTIGQLNPCVMIRDLIRDLIQTLDAALQRRVNRLSASPSSVSTLGLFAPDDRSTATIDSGVSVGLLGRQAPC